MTSNDNKLAHFVQLALFANGMIHCSAAAGKNKVSILVCNFHYSKHFILTKRKHNECINVANNFQYMKFHNTRTRSNCRHNILSGLWLTWRSFYTLCRPWLAPSYPGLLQFRHCQTVAFVRVLHRFVGMVD
jgi:hypothetical protein